VAVVRGLVEVQHTVPGRNAALPNNERSDGWGGDLESMARSDPRGPARGPLPVSAHRLQGKRSTAAGPRGKNLSRVLGSDEGVSRAVSCRAPLRLLPVIL
jgi:hypothetical protein